MTTSLEILTNEHKNILKVISAVENECEKLENGKAIDKEFLEKAIDFIRGYADKIHHSKEEDILFVEMCKNEENMHCNPTHQMRHEHDEGRKFVKELEKELNKGNKKKIIENAKGYCNLLKDHIYKEDNILYPMADESMDAKTKKSMLDKFNKIEKDAALEIKRYLSFVKAVEKIK